MKTSLRHHFIAIVLSFCAVTTHQVIGASSRPIKSTKDWNFIVYIAGNNDLHPFAVKNIQQMVRVGSTDSVNILVQFDQYRKRKVERYYIEKGSLKLLGSFDHSAMTTSGTKQSLYEFTRWAVSEYPATYNAIVLWNHGSGIKDPGMWGRTLIANRNKYFSLNSITGLFDIDREALEAGTDVLMSDHGSSLGDDKGIAFNDTHKEYLTNQDLKFVFDELVQNVLHRKIDLVCMDACHMGMMEVGSQIKDTVGFLAASAEVEPGEGYNYERLLSPFLTRSFVPADLAKHVVAAYDQEYRPVSGDFTQSSYQLDTFDRLEGALKDFTTVSIKLADTHPDVFQNLFKNIRTSYKFTTQFVDTDYIDLGHFMKSMIVQISGINGSPARDLLDGVKAAAQLVLLQMGISILANTAGRNFPNIAGMGFYFPKRVIDRSYPKTIFDQITGWSGLLRRYIRGREGSF